MGEVYRARDTRLDRDVAIKVLPNIFNSDPERLLRFHREAKLLAALNHPNIAQLHGLEDSVEGPALVMELVEGMTLGERLTHAPTGLPTDDVVAFARQLAEALDAAHARGIVHRDLKPANVAIAPPGIVKVLDFGLARMAADDDVLQTAQTTALGTREGTVLGTAPYMSPEQAKGERLDARTDLFSLGAVLYEMATGKRAFDGSSATLIIDAILHTPPPRPRSLNPSIPVGLDRLIVRLLERDLTRRYQRASEVVTDLRILARNLDAPRPVRLWQRAGVQLAAAVLLVAAAATATWLSLRTTAAPPAPIAAFEQVTDFPASAAQPSLSADGRLMTFVQGPSWFTGGGEVFVKALPDSEPVQLTHDGFPKMHPVFSPDGSKIAYTVGIPPSKWDTWTVPVLGGDARLWLQNAATLTWVPNGRVMFSETTRGLHMRVVSTTETRDDLRVVYSPEQPQGMVHWSHLSPDGSHVLVVEMEQGTWQRCRVVPFDASSPGQRVGPDGQCISAAWSPDGKWIYTSSLTAGAFHIWRQRFPDGPPAQITNGSNEEEGVSVSPDGRSLLVSVGGSQQAVWLRDRAGERAASGEGYAFVPTLPSAVAEPFSADGRSLFYLTRRGGARVMGPGEQAGELWRTDVETGRSEAVLPGFSVASYDVSADQTQVVFQALDKDNRSHVWLARLDHQLEPRQLAPMVADSPRFGRPDQVFMRARDESGSGFVFELNLQSGELRKVVSTPIEGFISASPDGRWLALRRPATVGNSGDGVVVSTSGIASTTMCRGCEIDWIAAGTRLVVRTRVRPFGNRTIVLPFDDELLKKWPSGGIQTDTDLKGLPILSSESGLLYPGPLPGQYAFTRGTSHRNIYRVPVPPE